MLRRSLPQLIAGSAAARPLDLAQGSYFGRRRPEDGRIDWRRARAPSMIWCAPWRRRFPGAFTEVNGCRLEVLETRVDDAAGRYIRPSARVCTPTDGDWYADCIDGRRLKILQSGVNGESRLRRNTAPPRACAHQPLGDSVT